MCDFASLGLTPRDLTRDTGRTGAHKATRVPFFIGAYDFLLTAIFLLIHFQSVSIPLSCY